MPQKEKVTKVIDGDTFKTSGRQNPVRLANVDTPEKGESVYQQAKRALERLIKGREVLIDTQARDSYGRSVANVKVSGKSVNKAMKRHDK